MRNTGIESLYANNVKIIDSGSITDCKKLKKVVLSKEIQSIGSYAFISCTSLQTIINFEYLKSIPARIFDSCCSILYLKIGQVSFIGEYSFNGCSAIAYITIESTTPPELQSITAFDGTNCFIYVPDDSVYSYKSATNWSSISSRIKSISSFTQ